jgi:hypothetical protein
MSGVESRCLIRRKFAEFLTGRGFPVCYSTLLKMAMPSRNDEPPAVGFWGSRALRSRQGARLGQEALPHKLALCMKT